MLSFSQSLPKIELHAHLSGSISSTTLESLVSKKDEHDEEIHAALQKGKFRSVDDCLAIFAYIHRVINSYERLYKVTREVITEFFKDGVVYLELRTSPCALVPLNKNTNDPNSVSLRTTYSSYLETVMEAVCATCHELEHGIVVRLLVSIDRRLSLEEVNTLVEVTLDHKQNHPLGQVLVCGMDLSSFPKAGGLDTFLPGLKRAQENGLPLALHVAEVCDQDEVELHKLLSIPASRIGHATFLHTHYPSLLQIVDEYQLVMEMCLTSNIKCQSVEQYEKHHLKYWWTRPGSKLCICTDDKGVFDCLLSEELVICAEMLNLSEMDLWQLQKQSIDYAFCNEECKMKLRQHLDSWKETNMKSYESS